MNIDTAKEEIVQSALEVTGEGEGTDPARNQGAGCQRRRQGQNQLPSLVCQPLQHVCMWLSPFWACSFVSPLVLLSWHGQGTQVFSFKLWASDRSPLSQQPPSPALAVRPNATHSVPNFFDFIPVWVSVQNFIHLVWAQNFKFVSFYAGNYWTTTSGNCKGVSTIPIEKTLLFLHVGCLEDKISQEKWKGSCIIVLATRVALTTSVGVILSYILWPLRRLTREVPDTHITYEKVSYLLFHFCGPIHWFHCYVVESTFKYVFVELSSHSETEIKVVSHQLSTAWSGLDLICKALKISDKS